jgi:hypothetical protein
MSLAVRLFAALIAAALAGCATVNPTATNARDWLVQYREGHGLSPVRIDSRLASFAQAQADAMAASDKLSHDVGGSFETRVSGAGLADGRIAENVLFGAANEVAAMRQWQNSPAHEKNFRMSGATRFGIAFARSNGPTKRTYWAMAIAADPPPPIPSMVDAGPVVQRHVVSVRRKEAEPGLVSGLTAPFASLFGN